MAWACASAATRCRGGQSACRCRLADRSSGSARMSAMLRARRGKRSARRLAVRHQPREVAGSSMSSASPGRCTTRHSMLPRRSLRQMPHEAAGAEARLQERRAGDEQEAVGAVAVVRSAPASTRACGVAPLGSGCRSSAAVTSGTSAGSDEGVAAPWPAHRRSPRPPRHCGPAAQASRRTLAPALARARHLGVGRDDEHAVRRSHAPAASPARPPAWSARACAAPPAAGRPRAAAWPASKRLDRDDRPCRRVAHEAAPAACGRRSSARLCKPVAECQAVPREGHLVVERVHHGVGD